MSGDRHAILVADLRLDNREELAAALGISAALLASMPDSALVLAAYNRWGDACPQRFLGDFSFAIWDVQAQTLFCARDHAGVRPFYYTSGSDTFAVASEMAALLALPGVTARPDDEQIAEYLTGELSDPAATFYAEIRRLPPGHTLTASASGVRLQSYWMPDPVTELRLGSDDEYAEAFGEILTEAVRCRLRSISPPAAMLSGGLDSSSIACLAERLRSERGAAPLRTFTCTYGDEPSCQEERFQRAVLASGRYAPCEVPVGGLSPLDSVDSLVAESEGPPFGPGLSSQRVLYAAIRQDGARVVLDGHGGDEAVSHGDGYLTELAMADRWPALIREARGISGTYGESPWPLIGSLLRLRLGRSAAFRTGWRFGGALRQRVLRQLGRPVGNADAGSIVSSDLARRVDLEGRTAARRRKLSRAARAERSLHHHVITDGRQSYALEVLDRLASAAGVEPRYPFWDKRLVEFCLSLPGDQKLRGGWPRSVLRRAMEGILPPVVQWRLDKTDFTPAIVAGLREHERQRLNRIFNDEAQLIAPYVNMDTIRQRYARFLATGSVETPGDVRDIWLVVSLALWLDYRQGASHARPASTNATFSQGLTVAATHAAS